MRNSWFKFAKAEDGKSATIDITNEIGFWGLTARHFKKELDALGDVEKITLNMHSPGGDVIDGLAIYNMLLQHPARVEGHVLGWAASMGSIILMACDEVHMPKNAYFVIHNPWSCACGEADDFRKQADLLDGMKQMALDAYLRHATSSREEVAALMDAESWLTGEEAHAHGFVQVVTEEIAAAASIPTARFENIPEAALKLLEEARAPETPDELDPAETAETPAEDGDADDAEVFAREDVEAAYEEGYDAGKREAADAAVATLKAQHSRAAADQALKLQAAEKAHEQAVADLVAKQDELDDVRKELDETVTKLDSLTAGFHYHPEGKPHNPAALHEHPFHKKMAELKAEGKTQDEASKWIDANMPELRQSLIAAANRGA